MEVPLRCVAFTQSSSASAFGVSNDGRRSVDGSERRQPVRRQLSARTSAHSKGRRPSVSPTDCVH
jgi:hypothetical protein